MSPVQRAVQKATVRVIASELDRRSAPVEEAIRDLQQHVIRIDAAIETQRVEMESLRAMRGTINAAHERLQARLDEAVLRMNTNDDAARLNQSELAQLRFDLEAARRSLADLTGVLERLTQPG
jgi:chromosome segregation ATPase